MHNFVFKWPWFVFNFWKAYYHSQEAVNTFHLDSYLKNIHTASMESCNPTKSRERRFRGNTGTGIDAYSEETPVISLAKAWKRRNVDWLKGSLNGMWSYEYFITKNKTKTDPPRKLNKHVKISVFPQPNDTKSPWNCQNSIILFYQ